MRVLVIMDHLFGCDVRRRSIIIIIYIHKNNAPSLHNNDSPFITFLAIDTHYSVSISRISFVNTIILLYTIFLFTYCGIFHIVSDVSHRILRYTVGFFLTKP